MKAISHYKRKVWNIGYFLILFCITIYLSIRVIRAERKLRSNQQTVSNYEAGRRTTAKSFFDAQKLIFMPLPDLALKKNDQPTNLDQLINTQKKIVIFLNSFMCDVCINEEIENIQKLIKNFNDTSVLILTSGFKIDLWDVYPRMKEWKSSIYQVDETKLVDSDKNFTKFVKPVFLLINKNKKVFFSYLSNTDKFFFSEWLENVTPFLAISKTVDI